MILHAWQVCYFNLVTENRYRLSFPDVIVLRVCDILSYINISYSMNEICIALHEGNDGE